LVDQIPLAHFEAEGAPIVDAAAEAGFGKPIETGWRTRWRCGTGRKTDGLDKTKTA
jgi:hypothetical protein